MAKMQWEEHKSEPPKGDGRLVGKLLGTVLGIALLARAENKALRQLIEDANIEIDEQEFVALRRNSLYELSEETRIENPDITHAIPSIQSLIDSGGIKLD